MCIYPDAVGPYACSLKCLVIRSLIVTQMQAHTMEEGNGRGVEKATSSIFSLFSSFRIYTLLFQQSNLKGIHYFRFDIPTKKEFHIFIYLKKNKDESRGGSDTWNVMNTITPFVSIYLSIWIIWYILKSMYLNKSR